MTVFFVTVYNIFLHAMPFVVSKNIEVLIWSHFRQYTVFAAVLIWYYFRFWSKCKEFDKIFKHFKHTAAFVSDRQHIVLLFYVVVCAVQVVYVTKRLMTMIEWVSQHHHCVMTRVTARRRVLRLCASAAAASTSLKMWCVQTVCDDIHDIDVSYLTLANDNNQNLSAAVSLTAATDGLVT